MTLEKLVEDAIIADFGRDSTLAQHLIRNHDYPGAMTGDDLPDQNEALSVIIVTAIDRGDFKMGCGIRHVGIEIRVRINSQADGNAGTMLDQLSELIRDRLQPSATVQILQGRESQFSNSNVKVFGIMQTDTTPRTESGFERFRNVTATFIAAQLA